MAKSSGWRSVHSYSSSSSPYTSRAHTALTYQFPSSPWASVLDQNKVSALGSRVGWTPARSNERTNPPPPPLRCGLSSKFFNHLLWCRGRRVWLRYRPCWTITSHWRHSMSVDRLSSASKRRLPTILPGCWRWHLSLFSLLKPAVASCFFPIVRKLLKAHNCYDNPGCMKFESSLSFSV